jgi:hypothetical protein
MAALTRIATAVIFLSSIQCYSKEIKTQPQVIYKENKGQVVDQNDQPRNDIRYYGNTAGMSFYLKNTGISYQLYKHSEKREGEKQVSTTIQRVDITWVGANPYAKIITGESVEGLENYYTVSTPALGVKSFEEITYKNIYPNIDLRYYSKNGNLKYDFIVKPGGDYKNIRLKIDGAAALDKIEDGSINIKTPIGDIIEGKPLVYQEGKTLNSEGVLFSQTITFNISDYDPSKELIIDPLVYQWVAGYGIVMTGVNDDGRACITDNSGNVFLTGTGALNISISGALLTKFSTVGPPAVFANIYGVPSPMPTVSYCTANDISVDRFDNIFLCGATNALNNVATTGAFQTTINGSSNAFLMKIGNSGIKLWGTYFGGGGNGSAFDCSADTFGNVYVFGSTATTSNFSTPGAHQLNYGGGGSDGFFAKFSSNGTRLYSSYYGGSGDETILGSTFDGTSIYFCGRTNSAGNISTAGSYQVNYLGSSGSNNGMLVKLDTNGNRLWGTYYGDYGTTIEKCSADDFGHVYFTGNTSASIGIATTGTFQPSPGGNSDAFLVKFTNGGQRVWGTYIGGSESETSGGCATSGSRVYAAGVTASPNNIATPGSIQPSITPLNSDAYILEFDSSGKRLWGSYYSYVFGSPYHGSIGLNCYADDSGNVYLCGKASAQTNLINTNAFILKLRPYTVPTPVISASPSTNFCHGDTVRLSTLNISGASYQWFNNGLPNNGATTFSFKTQVPGIYTVHILHNSSSDSSLPVTITEFPKPVTTVTTIDVLCYGAATASINISVGGAPGPFSYAWKNLPDTTSSLNNLSAGTFIATTTSSNSCFKKDTIQILQPPKLNIQHAQTSVPCSGASIASISLLPSGGVPPYLYSWVGLSDTTPSLNNLSVGTYVGTVMDFNGCIKTDSITIVQNSDPMPSDPLVTICSVTVDSATGKNMIVYEKTGSRHSSSYNIYRESSIAGQYSLIGSQLSNVFSTYIDNSSTPAQQSYRYRISEKDSCGNEFAQSPFHQTIHLSSNKGVYHEVNLNWNQYEGKSYPTHHVLRSFNGGPYINIADLPSTSLSYTDLNPPYGIKAYKIEIDIPAGCNPTTKSTMINRVSSNYVFQGLDETAIRILPNPTTNEFKIEGTAPDRIQLFDALGKNVLEAAHVTSVSVANLPAAVYIIKLIDKDGSVYYNGKIVKR